MAGDIMDSCGKATGFVEWLVFFFRGLKHSHLGRRRNEKGK